MSMVRISVNGRYLDVPTNVNISLQKRNNLFAFDDMETERSTSISLPATVNNVSIFEYGNNTDVYILQENSSGILTNKMPARLELDGVVFDGYLYVNQCNSDSFDCCFIFGDSLRLKEIKELGSIKDIVDTNSSVLFGFEQSISANKTNSMDIACAWYLSYIDELPKNKPYYDELLAGINVLAPFPSINTRLIAVQAASRAKFKPYIDTSNFQNLRLIPNKIEPNTECTLTIKGLSNPTEDSVNVNSINIPSDYLSYVLDKYVENNKYLGDSFAHSPDGSTTKKKLYGNVHFIRSYYDIILTFPSNFPDDVYLISEMEMIEKSGLNHATPQCTFLGDYSFDFDTKKASGTPLAGRAVTINSGFDDSGKVKKFLLYKFPNGYYTKGTSATSDTYYSFANIGTITASVNISFVNKAYAHGRVRLQDIYPDMDFVEFYKSIAYAQGDFVTLRDGKIKIATPEEVITDFDFIDVSDKIISQNEQIKRTFSDYAQSNVVAYDSADYVTTDGNRTYKINNSLLSENKKIYTIPYNYGSGINPLGLGVQNSVALVNKSATEGVAKNYTITLVSTSLSPTFLHRVAVTTNTLLAKLCENALQQVVRLSIPLYLYNLIDEYTLLTINGKKWVWLDGRYSNGEAEFTLQLYE